MMSKGLLFSGHSVLVLSSRAGIAKYELIVEHRELIHFKGSLFFKVIR